MSGRSPRLISVKRGTPIGSLAVGSKIKLNVNSVAEEFLIVHQGLPSSIYDASCDGTWLLMKDIYNNGKWSSSNNKYAGSSVVTYLSSTFLGLLDSKIRSAIKQVKIPYCVGGGSTTIMSGANGLSCEVFLLGGYEIGWTTSVNSGIPVDGAKLDYFESGTGTSAVNKRIAKLNGSAGNWWLRSPYGSSTYLVCHVLTGGGYTRTEYTYSYGIRPAFILPSDFLLSEEMLAA